MFTLPRLRTMNLRLGLPLLIFLLAACGSPVSGSTATILPSQALALANATTSAVPNSNLLAVLPELQQSLQAMQQIKTVHVAIQDKGVVQSGGLLLALVNGTRYSVRGAGDLDLTRHDGQLRLRLKLLPPQGAASSLTGAARLVGQKLYVQAPPGSGLCWILPARSPCSKQVPRA